MYDTNGVNDAAFGSSVSKSTDNSDHSSPPFVIVSTLLVAGGSSLSWPVERTFGRGFCTLVV